jgi:hypothetical protein
MSRGEPAGSQISRARADALLAKHPPGDPWEKTPDGSTLAWGESHLLHALVDLFEATGDVKYLEEVARRGERLLTHRDDRRGVKDGSGHSRPAWSMAGKYVVAEGTLVDEAGRPGIALRSTPTSHNNLTEIEVAPATGGGAGRVGRFSLRVANPNFRRSEQFDDLSVERNDPRFVEKVVNAAEFSRLVKAGRYTSESRLLRVTALPGAGVPRAQARQLTPIPLAYMGYLGVIYHPLLRFAEILHGEPRGGTLRPVADRFVQAAVESYADASQRLWRAGPNTGEGYYLCCERGESFPYDNVGEPFNYLGRHVAAQLSLYRLTGKAEYRERAEAMARLFQRRLRFDLSRGLYTWNYWYEPVTTTGWTPENSPSVNMPRLAATVIVEDVSHGVLDVALVVNAHRSGVVFDDQDLQRFATTLLRNVLSPERMGVNLRVDGTGGLQPSYFHAVSGWLELSAANAEVYQEIRRTVENVGTADLPIIAALLKWERKFTAAAR